MREKKLKNAPLKEAIFEVYWKLPNDKTNFPYDPDLEFALGIFKDAISTDYPILKRLVLPGINLKIYPNPQYQFWKGELMYPVIQLGPGILTVNDTDKNYSWEGNYEREIINALETLIISYKGNIGFNKVVLKYIDSVDVSEEYPNFYEFIQQNFNISLSNSFAIPGSQVGLNINQVFNIDEGSIMKINIQTAINNNTKKRAIIWITSVEKTVRLTKEEIASWVDKAHMLCSDTFVNMLNPEFYDKFNR